MEKWLDFKARLQPFNLGFQRILATKFVGSTQEELKVRKTKREGRKVKDLLKTLFDLKQFSKFSYYSFSFILKIRK
jgi:hypothetical protein